MIFLCEHFPVFRIESGCDAPLPVLHSYVQITTGNKTSDCESNHFNVFQYYLWESIGYV